MYIGHARLCLCVCPRPRYLASWFILTLSRLISTVNGHGQKEEIHGDGETFLATHGTLRDETRARLSKSRPKFETVNKSQGHVFVFVEFFVLKFSATSSQSFLLNILEKADFFSVA